MKKLPPSHHVAPCSLLGVLASLLLPLSAMADFGSVFAEPPFTKDQTVIGIEGWEMQHKEPHPVYTDPDAALLVESPISNPTQTKTLSLQTLIKNGRLAGLGDRFVVEAQIAVTFNPIHSFNGGLYFRFERTETTAPFHFGFYHGEGGGLYFQGEGEKVILLSKQDIIQGAAYKFIVHVDRESNHFRVNVTCESDKSFQYESKEVPFQESALVVRPKFSELYVGNNRPATVKAYINYIKVTH